MGIRTKASKQRGFTLMEAMVAAIVLATGLLSVLSLFAYSLSNLQMSQEDLIARAKAKEGLESVFSARDSSQIAFSQINNKANGGIFLDNFAPIYDPPGADGIANTDDDATSANSQLDAIILPGPDGVLGTLDDIRQPLTNFQRRITLSPVFLTGTTTVNNNLRLITVTVKYTVPQFGARQYQVSAYISKYR
ncbi:MAG TPA: prepilin-type N-terminal cleavage/methylation domain-containing protein [Candidatus Acidoferrum sp.]|nr:prepilin-type N-terminal cleavage/methylation domain-containing protein [Candidatus Acidoferrum sp.]